MRVRLRQAGPAGFGFLLLSVAAMAAPQSDEELAERLRECARTEQVDKRLECLQALANEAIKEDNAPPQVAAARVSAKSGVRSSTTREAKTVIVETRGKSITGVLAECRRSNTGGYLFYLEDGQIWKQIDVRKERFKTCDWPVTIVKAENGYRLILDEDDYLLVRRIK